ADFRFKSDCLGRARFWQGRTGEAIQILTVVDQLPESRGFLGYAYARTGRREEAERLAGDLNPFGRIATLAGLGDKDRTFEALDQAARTGPIRMGWILAWPELALLRGDPRLKALRKK